MLPPSPLVRPLSRIPGRCRLWKLLQRPRLAAAGSGGTGSPQYWGSAFAPCSPWSSSTGAAPRPPPVDRPEEGSPDDPVFLAQQVVDENPEDPFAHLGLALALMDVGEMEPAVGEIEVAQGLAGEEIPEIYLEAGEAFMEREMYFFAASSYVQYARLAGDRVPPDLRERMELALYLAAEDNRLMELLPGEDELDPAGLLLVETLQARFQLYHNREPRAQLLINNVLRREPGYPPALLVQVEIHWARDEIEPAVEILEQLVERDDVMPWVQELAAFYLEELRQ